MRGQMGIGTIIIFIAGILVAVIAAILFIQVTNNLKSQAMLTQRQAQESMANRFEIDKVEGVSFMDENTGEYFVKYLVFRVKPSIGSEGLDLKNTILTYSDGRVTIPAVKYVSLKDVFDEKGEDINVSSACDAELFTIMQKTNKFSYKEVIPVIVPVKSGNADYSRFTVVWEECGKEGGDLYTLSEGQTAYIVYAPKIPLESGRYITVDIHLAHGWSSPMKFRIPAGLDRGYVVIYPAS